MKRPNPGTKAYFELIEDFIETHDFKELAPKYNVTLMSIYNWFNDPDVQKARSERIAQKQQANYNVYYKHLPGVMGKRLALLNSDKTEPEVKRKTINDILEDTGQRTKQADTQLTQNVIVNPFDGAYEEWSKGQRDGLPNSPNSKRSRKTNKNKSKAIPANRSKEDN